MDKRGLATAGVLCAPGVRSFLCAGCRNGEGHVAPVYAKRSVASLLTVKHCGFGTFYVKRPPGALSASGCLVGVSWLFPGTLLGVSWCLLGVPKAILEASR